MIRKLNDLSHLIIGIVCFFPLGVIAEGGVFVSGPDGKVMPISREYIQAKFDLGKLTDIKNTLDVALIEDERKDVEVWELLARKIHAAEQPYNDYLELRDKANSDMPLLLEAKVWLEKALVIWTDNYDYREAQREIDSVIALVASGCYEIDRSRENSEREILRLIDESRSCKVDEDCEIIGFGCPFDCFSEINEKNISTIKVRIIDHEATYSEGKCAIICMQDCPLPPDEAKCIDNRCSTRF